MTPLTWNADVDFLPNGGRRMRVGVKWRNFLDDSGWQPIDISPQQAGGLFTVNKAPYSAEIPTLANGWSILQSTNRYNIWTRETMPDAPVGIQKRYPTAVSVAGKITAVGVRFPLAFPALLADRLVQFHEQEVRDLVVFALEPPGNGPVELPLEIDFGTLPILESTGRGKPAKESDFRNDKSIAHGLSFTTGRFRGVKLKQPFVWDSAGRREPITMAGKVVGSLFIGRKVIPRKFFENAVYPVYADTTATFYPDPDAESTTVDGVVIRHAAGIWASIQGGNGTGFGDNGTSLTSWIVTNSSNWDEIARIILLFDTASLPDSAVISSGSVNLYGDGSSDAFTDSIVVTASSPASNTGLAASDYQTIGSTAYSSTLALSGFSTSGYNALSLNASGRAAVATTGITKFSIRNESDRSNSEPGFLVTAISSATSFSADRAGTSNDPYLEVTYTEALGVTAAAGAFALTGNTANLLVGHRLSLGVGAFTETGSAAGIRAVRALVVTAATFIETAGAARLAHGYLLVAAHATFTETVNAAGLLAARKISAAVGSFTLTGVAAILNKTRLASLDAASFSLAGNDVALTKVGNKSFSADVGSFTLTGVATTLTYSRAILCGVGSFIETGKVAVLSRGKPISAASASFTFTGSSAVLLRSSRKLVVGIGAFTLTGQAARLKKGSVVHAAVGAFTETGVAAGLYRGRKVALGVGAFTLTGQAASLLHKSKLAAGTATDTLTGQDVSLRTTRKIVAAAGSYALTGVAAGLSYVRKVVAATGSYVLTGNTAGLRATRRLTAAGTSFALTGNGATFSTTRKLTAAAGAFVETVQAARLLNGYRLTASPASFIETANTARLPAARRMTAGAASYALTGRSADVVARRQIVAAKATYTLTANAAGLSLGNRPGHEMEAKLVFGPRLRARMTILE